MDYKEIRKRAHEYYYSLQKSNGNDISLLYEIDNFLWSIKNSNIPSKNIRDEIKAYNINLHNCRLDRPGGIDNVECQRIVRRFLAILAFLGGINDTSNSNDNHNSTHHERYEVRNERYYENYPYDGIFDSHFSPNVSDTEKYKRELLNELDEYQHYPIGWDGEDGKPINEKVYQHCVEIINKYYRMLSSWYLSLNNNGTMFFISNEEDSVINLSNYSFSYYIEKDSKFLFSDEEMEYSLDNFYSVLKKYQDAKN